MILAIETATPVCSVAYMAEDGSIHEKRESGRGVHSEKLFLFIETLMKEHSFRIGDLEEILLSSGPGSYTGLRIGAAAVKGLLFRQETTLFLLGSLEAMAAGAFHVHPEAIRVHSLIDARRQHLYHQEFEIKNGEMSGSSPATTAVTDIDKAIMPGDVLIGTGLERLITFQHASGAGIRKPSEGFIPDDFAQISPGTEKSRAEKETETALFMGEFAISAVNLIRARNDTRFSSWFRAVQPEQFEPEYLSVG